MILGQGSARGGEYNAEPLGNSIDMEDVETFTTPELVPREQVENVLGSLAAANPEQFKVFFKYLRTSFPRQTMAACVRHIGACGSGDSLMTPVVSWLKIKNYLEILLDPQCCSQAVKVFVQAEIEPGANRAAAQIRRRSGSGERGWLRDLTTHPDERIRSLDRECQESRRSEALWPARTPEANAIFRQALADPHHRVVVNALIGLHRQHDSTAFERLLELCAHASEMHRAAAVWALGYLAEASAIPVLEILVEKDESPAIREKAGKVLAGLPPKQDATEATAVA